MAIVRQYPHYLFIEEAGESVQDETGNWTEAEATRTFMSMCRVEPDGRGTEYDVAGGDYIKATALVQCPATCPVVAKGTKIFVANDSECADVRISGVCLNFDKAQLHSRLWV